MAHSRNLLFDPANNNRGATTFYWYDQPEKLSVRFSWTRQYFNLSAFQATPVGLATTRA